MYDATTGGLSANAPDPDRRTRRPSATRRSARPATRRAVNTLADRLNANGAIIPGWTEVARRSNVVGELLYAEGIRYFYHPEQNWFQFFDATVHPELKDVNRLEWFIANTDRRYVLLGAGHPPLVLGRRPVPEVGRLALRPVPVGARATTSA